MFTIANCSKIMPIEMELAHMGGDGSRRTCPCERGRKDARGRRAGPRAPEGRGAEGGGIWGRREWWTKDLEGAGSREKIE